MDNLIDNQEIEIPCSKCGCKTKKSIGWLKNNNYFICTCGTKINLDTSQFKDEIAKVDSAFAELQKTLKKFGK